MRLGSSIPLRLALGLCAATSVAGVAAGAVPVRLPTVRTDRGCYLVHQSVELNGAGFAPSRTYEVTIDGVDFGTATTDVHGAFSTSLGPGGLAAGVGQQVDVLGASDGTSIPGTTFTLIAGTTFTLTRLPRARLLASTGGPRTLRAPFEIWGFARDGRRRPVYLHYLTPKGRLRATVALGETGGQCGHLLTAPRRVFPFVPTAGTWNLQLDTSRAYAARPRGPVARIPVQITP